MRRVVTLLALVLTAALAGGIALADSFNPVTLTTTVLSPARVGSPLKVRVTVSADPGVLDARSSPMEVEARLAPECGGTYLDTAGAKLMAKLLDPQPAYGKPYRATITGAGTPTATGPQAVCIWLVSAGDQRLYASDASTQVTVAAAHHRGPRRRRGRRHPRHARHGRAVLAADASASAPPPIRHAFVIPLENESESTTFGPNSPAPYLAHTLVAQGAFLSNYYSIGHPSNPNYIAMVSGQAPNAENQTDCPLYNDFPVTATAAYGQQQGLGCVYPASVPTIAGQLDAAGYTWGDFAQSMGNDPTREASVCGHPAPDSQDHTQSETSTDAYAARHNPFVYFHSIIDNTTLCDTHVVNLNLLAQDLRSAATTPNYSFIVPDLCSDGHDATCAQAGRPGGYAGIDQFLEQWIPKITASPAYRYENGLIIITFDEAATSDTSSCCGEVAGPGSPEPGMTGMGGGKVGAVLLSPCIRPGTVSNTPYNHYTMLGSVENLFGLPHLGYAGLPGETYFGPDVYTDPGCAANLAPPVTVLRVHRNRVRFDANLADSRFTVELRGTGARYSHWRVMRRGVPAGTLTLHLRPGTYLVRAQAVSPAGVPGHFTRVKLTVRRPARARPDGPSSRSRRSS
jgi:hypothetical protein